MVNRRTKPSLRPLLLLTLFVALLHIAAIVSLVQQQ